MILIFSLFYTSNLKEGVDLIIKQCPILLTPICLIFSPKVIPNKKTLNKTWNYFVFINVILCLFLISNFIYYYTSKVGFSARFFREVLSKIEVLDLHPTYVSAYMGIAVLYLIDKLSNKIDYIKLGAVILLVSVILVLTSRIGIIALLVALVIYFVTSIKKRKNTIFLGGMLFAVIALVYSNDFIQKRFTRIYSSGLVMPDSHNLTSTNLRTGIFYCTLLITKEDWLTGIGVGDLQFYLNECYKENFDTTLFQRRQFNTHNHYLFLFASAGIFSVLAFLIFIVWNMRFLHRKKNFFLISIFVFLLVIFCTESFLQRAYGIATYNIFIITLLCAILENSQNKKEIIKV
ncbi:O-antigen ligase [uncultured Maribacter sp.]|uniref:O-antigen ligase family protein n=1 Tax=uncultured Maribacter sp. TaxID=431308 RepID=UPI002614C2B5|nr:O-antigen ligase family protein [uncultured Maribacter sp.]